MVNYYQELDLQQALTGEAMEAALKKARQRLINRINAPELAKRQEAERKLQLVDEAAVVLCDKNKKAKYDKELAKSGGSAAAAAAPQYNQQAQDANASNEMLIKIAEDMYNAGNGNDAINICNRILSAGIKDSRVYFVMGMSYFDLNNQEAALRVFQNAVAENPEDYGMILYLARLCAQIGRVNEAENYINSVLAKQPDNTFAHASMVEVELIRNNAVRAEQLVTEINTKYPNDGVFKTNVAAAYERAAFRLISTAKNGAGYLASKEDAEKYVSYIDKAHSLNPNEHMKNELAIAQDQKKKKFDMSNWKGIVCLLLADVVTFMSINENGVLPFIICLLITLTLLFFNFKEKWQVKRKLATKKKDPIDYLLLILGALLVVVIGIVKIAWSTIESANRN